MSGTFAVKPFGGVFCRSALPVQAATDIPTQLATTARGLHNAGSALASGRQVIIGIDHDLHLRSPFEVGQCPVADVPLWGRITGDASVYFPHHLPQLIQIVRRLVQVLQPALATPTRHVFNYVCYLVHVMC